MNRIHPVAAAIAALFLCVAFPAMAQAPVAAKTSTHSVHRQKGADGPVDATRTSKKGGVTTVDRSKNADGTTDNVVTTMRP